MKGIMSRLLWPGLAFWTGGPLDTTTWQTVCRGRRGCRHRMSALGGKAYTTDLRFNVCL